MLPHMGMLQLTSNEAAPGVGMEAKPVYRHLGDSGPSPRR